MNIKRLRELSNAFIAENYPDEDSSIMPDGVSAEAIKSFIAYVKAKEKERRNNEFTADSAPMIGLNPFRDEVTPSDKNKGGSSRDFNTLLNDKSRE